ncbi:uncharacterized protein J4E88_003230 [Alternaria novae-zelandiae]|uniref:uncharacterized protein n=1 Tax=Alternaria novae-zelandiae TaxID=430562 RepID=UPI0020C253B7|nr:uncharacterized protein J4E88_003230 [Alternaria novae-zelandiae]KAI4687639.1 hypothetical protein J4E88_003230 [Alternaria novae-zelandiae]
MISVDTRWTFFQAPLEVEDAFGVRFPIPTEYDYGLIDTVIRYRFKIGGGAMEVSAGNYELCRKQNRFDIINESSRLQPGTAITMFIIISMRIDKEAVWPMPRCESAEVIPSPGGGSVCSNRDVEYYQANGMSANIEETLSNNTKSFPLKQLVYTSDQPSNLVSYNILERTTRRNVRYDPFGNYPSPYIPVIEAIAKMEGVISCASVSIGGVVDGRFFATVQMELEHDIKDKPPRCVEVGRLLSKCLDPWGIDSCSVHCHVDGKHIDNGARQR